MIRAGAIGTLSAVIAATGYGSAYVVARMTYDLGTNAITLNALRFVALLAIHLAWIGVLKGDLRLPARALSMALLLGILIAGSGTANLSSIAFIPVSLAILVFYTYPLVTLILSSIVDRRAPDVPDYLAFASAFVGLALALEVSLEDLNLLGVLLALLGSLGAGTHLVVAQHAMRIADFKTVTVYMSLSACLVTGLVAVAIGKFAVPTPGTGLWLLGYVIAGFCLGIAAMLTAVRLVGPVQTSIIMCLEPPIVIGFAYLLLGERLTLTQFIGAALVVVGITIAQRSSGRR